MAIFCTFRICRDKSRSSAFCEALGKGVGLPLICFSCTGIEPSLARVLPVPSIQQSGNRHRFVFNFSQLLFQMSSMKMWGVKQQQQMALSNRHSLS